MAMRTDREAGFTTVEFAAVLPLFVATLAVGLFAITAAVTQVQASDAARDIVLAIARGEDPGAIPVPNGGTVAVDGNDPVTATVTIALRPWGELLPPLDVSGSASTFLEPGSA